MKKIENSIENRLKPLWNNKEPDTKIPAMLISSPAAFAESAGIITQPAPFRAKYGFRNSSASNCGMDHQSWRSRRIYVRSQHLSGQPGGCGFLRTNGQGNESQSPAKSGKNRCAAWRCSWIPYHRRYYASFESFYRKFLPRSAFNEPADARNVLPDGRANVHPSTLYPGGVGTVATIQDPSLYVVLMEDSAAIVSIFIAFLGVYLGHKLHNPALDSVASHTDRSHPRRHRVFSCVGNERSHYRGTSGSGDDPGNSRTRATGPCDYQCGDASNHAS